MALVLGDEAEKGTADERRAALAYLSDAWAEARLDGIDGDCLAQVALFTALGELVTTYGEEAHGDLRRRPRQTHPRRRIHHQSRPAVSAALAPGRGLG